MVRQDEAKLVLAVDVYLRCDEDDQEYASIMAREEWWSQISSWMIRFTSYRSSSGREGVITSYSIHYTKLYDCR